MYVETLKELLKEKQEALAGIEQFIADQQLSSVSCRMSLERARRQVAVLEKLVSELDFPRPFSVTK